jgi:hypothetical protein
MTSRKKKYNIIERNLNFESQQLQMLQELIEIKQAQFKEENS